MPSEYLAQRDRHDGLIIHDHNQWLPVFRTECVSSEHVFSILFGLRFLPQRKSPKMLNGNLTSL